MEYRKEIDGLRALAVLPVILFHAGVEFFSGGYVGVDVFFVISGYLITTIILKEKENNSFSIAKFYDRRARRILPALFFIMIICIPFSWHLMLPSQLKDFSQSIIAVVLFVSNILFWKQSGYFETSAEEKPLLHTWSLAVEEQYYVIFPVFIVVLWKAGKHNLVYLIAIATILSFTFAEYASRNHPNANFFLTPMRAWELLVGSLTAFATNMIKLKKNNYFSITGLILILLSIIVFDDSLRWPSAYTLLPVTGVVLIILYTKRNSLTYRFLSTKILVGIGLISYSAYLWHQPLFAFARVINISEPPIYIMLSLALASLGFAYLSWKYVETPFRKHNKISTRTLAIVSSACAGMILSIGIYGHKTNGYEQQWLLKTPKKTQITYSLLSSKADHPRQLGDCIFRISNISNHNQDRINQCMKIHGKGVAILGDSHAVDLFGALGSNMKSRFIVGVSTLGCRPHQPEKHCHYESFKNSVKKHNSFHTIIYEQAGFYLLKDSKNKIEGNREMFTRHNYTEMISPLLVQENNIYLVKAYLESLTNYANIIWVGPRIEHHIPRRVLLRKGCDYSYKLRPGIRQSFTTLDTFIDNYISINSSSKLTYLSQIKAYNFNPERDIISCNASFWSDGDHWSLAGEKKFGHLITKVLNDKQLLGSVNN